MVRRGTSGDVDAACDLVREWASRARAVAVTGIREAQATGLYAGRPLTERSVEESGQLPDRVTLYRSPILLEWCDSGETLEHLVAHVLIHEIGHHFGLSDEDMHRLEDAADE